MTTIRIREMTGFSEDALDSSFWMEGGPVTVRPFVQCESAEHPYDTQWVPYTAAARCSYCGQVICNDCNFADDGEQPGCHRCVVLGE